MARDAIKIRDITNNEGQLAKSYDNYCIVKKGDFVLNPMDLYSGANCNVSFVEGVISPAYSILKIKNNYDVKLLDYFFKTLYWQMILYSYGKGVSADNRWTLTKENLLNIPLPCPPKEIQQKIVEILDKKCGQIDELVRIEENEIEKLKEYKTSLITKVVTKGLDPNAKMKDSGIPWIGQIPESWIVAKIKNVVEICNGKEVEDNDGEVLVYGSGGIFGKTSKIMYDNESVLLGRKGTVDRPIYLKDIKFWCVDTMFYTKSKNLILMKLFYYIMFIFDYKPYIYGTALPSMSQSILNEIYIPLAKNVVQQQIVEYLDKMCEEIDNLIKIKQEKIEKLKEYKKSLIYQYVTGKKEVI